MRRIKNVFHLCVAVFAQLLYGFPTRNLTVLAITGTDGKTTTTSLLYHILKSAGKKVTLVSTVAAYIGDEELDTGFHVTTPSPFALFRLLKKIAQRQFTYVVLEVTSHGIDQNRVWGIAPLHAAITNITHEHLDYHKSYEQYATTKAKLLLRSTHAYINADDPVSIDFLRSHLSAQHKEYTELSVATSPKLLKQAALHRFPHQDYNVGNAAIAGTIAIACGVSEKSCAAAIKSFPGVPGRLERVGTYGGINVIVDFAHTPNALEHVLKAVRAKQQKQKGRLIVVFGCAGLRDHSKRPKMGAIASRLADLVVLTAEDPRTEDVWSIISQIKSGILTKQNKIISIADRYQAIHFALRSLARPQDTVIITGKGHERSMCYGTTEYPWNDADAVATIMGDRTIG